MRPPEGQRNPTQPAHELEGYVLVPEKPTEAMLRPFYECPPEELDLAWQAMVAIVRAQRK